MTKLSVLMATLLFVFSYSTISASTIKGVADNAFVMKNNSLVFDVLENDIINGEMLGFGIEIYPVFGEVSINEDQSVTYKPFENVCEEMDYFYYYIEDEEGPKLVEVSVEILCEPLTIINGFHREVEENQEEDIPTSFTILGVENFPDNFLYVFSDSGEEIFYAEGYTNEWNGAQGTKSEVEPDRIYYYVFNDGLGSTYCGYLQMN